NRLNRKLEELMDEKDKITEYIYSQNDSDLRQILSYKYVNGLTWKEIGDCMNYDESTVRKKHNKWFNE
ncbi:MAG: RNA polymerase sigma factor sigma-70 region 4 domain-containing protein, partial [Ruminiclostridium sp.]